MTNQAIGNGSCRRETDPGQARVSLYRSGIVFPNKSGLDSWGVSDLDAADAGIRDCLTVSRLSGKIYEALSRSSSALCVVCFGGLARLILTLSGLRFGEHGRSCERGRREEASREEIKTEFRKGTWLDLASSRVKDNFERLRALSGKRNSSALGEPGPRT